MEKTSDAIIRLGHEFDKASNAKEEIRIAKELSRLVWLIIADIEMPPDDEPSGARQ